MNSVRHRLRSIAPLVGLVRSARNTLTGKSTSAMRALWIGEVQERALTPDDLGALLDFARKHLWMSEGFLTEGLLRRWPHGGGAWGALDADGALWAVGFLDQNSADGIPVPGWWIRGVTVRQTARGLGMADRLIRGLVGRAREQGIATVRAAIAPDNVASLRVFARMGFTPVTESEREQLCALWRTTGPTQDWRILERSTGA